MLNSTVEKRRKEGSGEVFKRAIVIDACGGPISSENLEALKAGVTATQITLSHSQTPETWHQTLKTIYDHYTLRETLPDKATLVEKAEDIQEAKQSGRIGMVFALQNCALIGYDISLLSILHKLGLRVTQLTYNETNYIGDGCVSRDDRPLTHFGKQVVRELNRLGIVVDLSHCGVSSSLSALEVSTKPVVFSHSDVFSITPNPRCVRDEQIKAIARNGGVIGVSPFSPMCSPGGGKRPTIEDYLNHIDYISELVGIDHVAIATDIFEQLTAFKWNSTSKRRYPEVMGQFTFETLYAEGFSHIHEIANVASGLADRGYKDYETEKVLGKNLLRIYQENWERS